MKLARFNDKLSCEFALTTTADVFKRTVRKIVMLRTQLGMFYKRMWACKKHTNQERTIYRRYCSARSSFSKLTLHVNGISLENFIKDLFRQYIDNNTPLLKPIAMVLGDRKAIIEQLESLNELVSDKDEEIAKMASEERASYLQSLNCIDDALMDAVLNAVSDGDNDSHTAETASMMLEVNAGVGGQEAMLFASELFAMYLRFIEYKGWDHYVAEEQRTDLGGMRSGSVIIHDLDAYRWLQYEAGVHRVQRIPSTEKGGRVHTSTASVHALPQATHIEVHLPPGDLRVETKRAAGAGGQHVNTTDSAVRIVHVPSGVAVECQTDRSQIKNRQMALERLRAKLHALQLREQLAQSAVLKSAQVQSSCRNHKVRTYNYSQDRITDHRLQQPAATTSNVYNIKAFLFDGKCLENLICRLDVNVKYDKLFRAVQEFERNNK